MTWLVHAMVAPILRIEHLSKGYATRATGGGAAPWRRQETLKAVVDLSLDVFEGETFGLVGESGCGKTTLGRLIVGLEKPDAGQILFRGSDTSRLKSSQRREIRRRIQMVFQDPYSSLNPRMKIGEAIAEPMRVHGIVGRNDVRYRVDELLGLVGLSASVVDRYPRELSGGQRQRVGIARALSVRPEVLIADEAVSSLDVSIRAQILNLLQDLRDQLRLTLLFISHDLSVVEYLSDRVGVMYLGRMVELGPARTLFAEPAHPYTRGLIAAVPSPDPDVRRAEPAVRGELPSAIHPPSGCVFRTRCPIATQACHQPPPVRHLDYGHWAACFFPYQPVHRPGDQIERDLEISGGSAK